MSSSGLEQALSVQQSMLVLGVLGWAELALAQGGAESVLCRVGDSGAERRPPTRAKPSAELSRPLSRAPLCSRM